MELITRSWWILVPFRKSILLSFFFFLRFSQQWFVYGASSDLLSLVQFKKRGKLTWRMLLLQIYEKWQSSMSVFHVFWIVQVLLSFLHDVRRSWMTESDRAGYLILRGNALSNKRAGVGLICFQFHCMSVRLCVSHTGKRHNIYSIYFEKLCENNKYV